MTRAAAIAALACALASVAGADGGGNGPATVASPLGGIGAYVFTVPACGAAGIQGRIMSLEPTSSNRVLRAEDRAFLAEASAARTWLVWSAGNTNATITPAQDPMSGLVITGGHYSVAVAWEPTNHVACGTLIETTSIGGFSTTNIGMAIIGAPLTGTNPGTFNRLWNASPLLAKGTSDYRIGVIDLYRLFTPFAVVPGAGDVVVSNLVMTSETVWVTAGDLNEYENGTTIDGPNVYNYADEILGGFIYSDAATASKQNESSWVSDFDSSTWSREASSTILKTQVDTDRYTVGNVSFFLYSGIAASVADITEASIALDISTSYSGHIKDEQIDSDYDYAHTFVYAVPAQIVVADGVVVLRAVVDAAQIAALVKSALPAGEVPDMDRSALLERLAAPTDAPSAPETAGNPSLYQEATTYGAKSVLSEIFNIGISGCAVLVNMTPKATHPQLLESDGN